VSAMIGNPLLLGGGDYEISRSVRLRASASANLNRTSGTPTDNNIWTYSLWVKKATNGSETRALLNVRLDASNFTQISFNSNDQLNMSGANSGTTFCNAVSTAVYRDPSAWYHIVVVADRSQATDSNRIKMYVNGVQITVWATTPTWTNTFNSYINNASRSHEIGRFNISYFDGYLTEINFIDGQALTPSSFGETDAITGVWKPKKYAGTYGTNGFYLNFSDNSNNTAATIGKDYSGNGNNWTPNNISVTSGVTYDSMLDVPTQWADGGNGRGNYAVLNPLTLVGSGTGSLSNGNLTLTSPTSDAQGTQTAGTIAVSSGKYYWEETFTTLTSGSGYLCAGLQDGTVTISGLSGSSRSGANTWWVSDDGNYRANGGSVTSSGLGAFSAGDVAMIAVDMDNKIAWIGKNGTWVGSPSGGTGNTFSSLPNLVAPFAQAIRNTTTSSVINANFGQRPFAYTPPTGFKALNTLNLPEPTIKKGNQYFDVVTRNGSSGPYTTTVDLTQGALIWDKTRSAAGNHNLIDSVRGISKLLQSNNTNAEGTDATFFTAFNNKSYTTGAGDYGSGTTLVDWIWQESASAGFDIVTYTGSASAQNISHSLGVAPKLVIVKARGTPNGTARDWLVWHGSFTSTEYIFLNLTNAKSSGSGSLYWNSTLPNSTQFSVGTDPAVNWASNNYVAYLFSEVAGFSRFGSYTGNGSSDGPFVFTGFRPAFLMIKRTDSTGSWFMNDDARPGYNVNTFDLQANSSGAESSNSICDFTANGFKIRIDGLQVNASGGTFVFMAFAENPFKNALAR
jgi:hypothetical protein